MLRIGRSLVRSQLLLPIALWPWGRLSLYQKWVPGVFPGGKGGRCVRLTTLSPSCAVVTKSGSLKFLEPSGPVQACNETALFFYWYIVVYWRYIIHYTNFGCNPIRDLWNMQGCWPLERKFKIVTDLCIYIYICIYICIHLFIYLWNSELSVMEIRYKQRLSTCLRFGRLPSEKLITKRCFFFHWYKRRFWYFAARASQYIYLNINQLDALNFIMSLYHASTCFEHMCSSSILASWRWAHVLETCREMK